MVVVVVVVLVVNGLIHLSREVRSLITLHTSVIFTGRTRRRNTHTQDLSLAFVGGLVGGWFGGSCGKPGIDIRNMDWNVKGPIWKVVPVVRRVSVPETIHAGHSLESRWDMDAPRHPVLI